MLTLTPAANEAVEAIVAQLGETEDAGLRLTSAGAREDGPGPGASLELSVVPGPEPDDATLEGTPVYVEPETAEFLENKVLDAELGDDQIRFSLYDQPTG